jgi:Zn-dependent oligopeptidase
LSQWDVGFWAERLKEAKYALEEEQLRPYFSLAFVLEVNGAPAMSQLKEAHQAMAQGASKFSNIT